MPAEEALPGIESFISQAKSDLSVKYKGQQIEQLSVDSFERIKTLGTGSFGRVLLMKYKQTGNFYAVKVMSKVKIVEMNQVNHVYNEKKILQSLRFPFLMYMEFCFKDNSNIYFVLPFIAGGEMFSYLRKVRRFQETQSRFYGAQVVLALEFLHALDILYRDLKPENIMIDIEGYLKITDMGFCKIVKGRTYTLCGTPEYMAPEILKSKPYGKSVDWWACGVLLFEMTSGSSPFAASDPMKIYEKVITCQYVMPPYFSVELKDLVRNLLQTDITRRYGSLKNGVDDIKNHKWFGETDWIAILNKTQVASYIPKYSGGADTSNFDKYEEVDLDVKSVDKFQDTFAFI